MSNPEEKPAIELNAGSLPAQTVTVVPRHEGEDAMGLRSMTVGRYEEIRRRLADGRGVREIVGGGRKLHRYGGRKLHSAGWELRERSGSRPCTRGSTECCYVTIWSRG